MEFATQDADPKVFEPLRKPIQPAGRRVSAVAARQPAQAFDAVLELAGRAYRRPLTAAETQELGHLYADLRDEELPHDEAIRLLLARVLVAPAFLYRIEKPPAGAAQQPVHDWELASRLSYFLWSSLPDAELRELAAAGQLADRTAGRGRRGGCWPTSETRRLATEFACQWLHIHDFDHLDEKSEQHFPTFAALRGAMYEESIQFFTDLFQHDGSVLDILDADHTFLNEDLADHYGIPGVSGPEWRRVDGVQAVWPRRHSGPGDHAGQAIGRFADQPDLARQLD